MLKRILPQEQVARHVARRFASPIKTCMRVMSVTPKVALAEFGASVSVSLTQPSRLAHSSVMALSACASRRGMLFCDDAKVCDASLCLRTSQHILPPGPFVRILRILPDNL